MRSDLAALGCSALLHGAVAAGLVALYDRTSPQPTPSVAMAMLWTAAAAVSQEPDVPSTDNAASSVGAGADDAAAAPTEPTEPAWEQPATEPPAAAQAAGTTEQPGAEPAEAAPAAPEKASTARRERPSPSPPPAAPARRAPSPSAAETPPKDDGRGGNAPPATSSSATDAATDPSSDLASAQAMAGPATPAWSVISRVPPLYPMQARRRGIEGDVSLRVAVAADGRPSAVTVRQGSGDPRLDAAAAQAVAQWRFAVAEPMTVDVPVKFRLSSDTAEAAP